MKPIKIVYNVESMEVAGAERVVLSLIGGLDRRRFAPVVCCLTEKGPLAEKLEAQDVPVIALGKDPNHDLPVIPKMMKVLRKTKAQIVHTHSWPANVWGRIAARLVGTPIILASVHSVHAWKGGVQLTADKWLAAVSDKVICVSDAVKEFCIDRANISPDKLLRIHNGIDLAPFGAPLDILEKRRELGTSPDAPVLIVVGRLMPDKGHRFFFESLVQIRKKFPSVVSWIAGDGPSRKELESQSRALGLEDHIKFLGERDDVPALLRAADIFVLPSLREGLPLCALEASAAGKPAVVTDVGGTREAVVDGVNGLVVKPADPSLLTSSILRLLQDQALAFSMGYAGKKRVREQFSLEHMVSAHEELYEQFIRAKIRRRQTDVIAASVPGKVETEALRGTANVR